jgi:hypothetical protein
MLKEIVINGIRTQYKVSDIDGVIINDDSGHIMKHQINKYGYHVVLLSVAGKPMTMLVHRLVAMAYIPNPENKRTVNHKTGDKNKNSVTDLEWATDKENVDHAWNTGLCRHRSGEDIGNNVYTSNQIHEVCKMIENGEISNILISHQTGVRENIISFIRRGKLWRDISSKYNFPVPRVRDCYSKLYGIIDECILNHGDIEHIYETKCKCMKRHAFTSLVRRRRIKISKTLND